MLILYRVRNFVVLEIFKYCFIGNVGYFMMISCDKVLGLGKKLYIVLMDEDNSFIVIVIFCRWCDLF